MIACDASVVESLRTVALLHSNGLLGENIDSASQTSDYQLQQHN